MGMTIFDKTMDALAKNMELAYRRHTVLATNVANAETPNYRAREFDFNGELQKALSKDDSPVMKTNPLHMDVGEPGRSHVIYDNAGTVGADGNNVDMDVEMGKLTSNSGRYDSAVTMLQLKLQMLQLASRSRGG